MSQGNRHLLAVDLGGTKVAAALITLEGAILARCQEPTSQEGPQAGIHQIGRLLRTLLQEQGIQREAVEAIGVGIPAVLEPGSDLVIWAPNLSGWEHIDLRGGLQSELGLPVTVEYDGHTAVLGEWWQGAGRGFRSLVYLIVGTGIGGGMILDGRLYRGLNRLAGAAGWFVFTTDPQHEDALAVSRGFWESLAAGPGFSRRAVERLRQQPDSPLYSAAQAGALNPAQVFQAAGGGERYAQELLDELAGYLGLGIANLVSLINPEIVILGGGIGAQCGPLLPRVRQVMERWAQPVSARSVKLAVSEVGNDAGLYGAAYAALLRQRESTAIRD